MKHASEVLRSMILNPEIPRPLRIARAGFAAIQAALRAPTEKPSADEPCEGCDGEGVVYVEGDPARPEPCPCCRPSADERQRECAKWDCDGDHKYYSHDTTTGKLVPWEEA